MNDSENTPGEDSTSGESTSRESTSGKSTEQSGTKKPKRAFLGCFLKSSLIGVSALTGGVYLMGTWDRANGFSRAGAVILVLIGAVFMLPPLLIIVGFALKHYFGHKLKKALGPMGDLIEQNKAIWADKHQYRPATDADFAEANREYYESATRELEQLEFSCVGDVVNETIEKASGSTIVIRRFISADKTIMAAIYHFTSKTPPSWLEGQQMLMREFETEFSDGSYLGTANTQETDLSTLAPGFTKNRLPLKTPLGELLKKHEESKVEILASRPTVQCTLINSAEDLDAAQQRQHLVKAGFRKAMGHLDPEEVRRVSEKKFPDDPEIVDVIATSADVARQKEKIKSETQDPPK